MKPIKKLKRFPIEKSNEDGRKRIKIFFYKDKRDLFAILEELIERVNLINDNVFSKK